MTVRVLHVIDSLAPGGAERSLAELAPVLCDRGVELHVAFLIDRPGLADALLAAGAELHDLSAASGRRGRVSAVARSIGAIRPDVVHTTLYEADQAGRIAAHRQGRPVISSLVSETYGPAHRAELSGRGVRLRAAQALDIATARVVTEFHAVSSSVADVMAGRLRVRRDRIDVIPRGRDGAVLASLAEHAAAMRSRFGVPEGAPLVVGVGRLVHAKGHDVLVQAVPLLRVDHPDLCVLVAGGDGDAADALRAGPVDPALSWCGHVDDVAALIAAADVLAFPSRREGMPGTVIEAFAVGTPVVCSDIAALRELVGSSDPVAVVVPVDDPRALADGLAAVLDRRLDVTDMTDRARRRFAAQFTIESTAARHVAQYERVAAGG